MSEKMLRLPREYKKTIAAMVAADPEVALATCDIPHLDPSTYLIPGGTDEALPYCGCFVGVYAWMQECKAGRVAPPYYNIPEIVSERVHRSKQEVSTFAGWCYTAERDQEAVLYARWLLENTGPSPMEKEHGRSP